MAALNIWLKRLNEPLVDAKNTRNSFLKLK